MLTWTIMLVFVQAINIPRSFSNKEQLQHVLCNVGRVNHVSFHDGHDSHYFNAVIHLEISKAEFNPMTLTVLAGEQITFNKIPDKFVKMMIGDDIETHVNTPCINKIGTRIWDNNYDPL